MKWNKPFIDKFSVLPSSILFPNVTYTELEVCARLRENFTRNLPFTVGSECLSSVANLAILLLYWVTIQTPLATFFKKKNKND